MAPTFLDKSKTKKPEPNPTYRAEKAIKSKFCFTGKSYTEV